MKAATDATVTDALTCDTCRQPIASLSDAWAEWRAGGTFIRVVHHPGLPSRCAEASWRYQPETLRDHHLAHFAAMGRGQVRTVFRRFGIPGTEVTRFLDRLDDARHCRRCWEGR